MGKSDAVKSTTVKNVTALIPRIETGIQRTENQVLVVVDGAPTILVNGSIRQNGLELILRLEQQGAAMLELAGKARKEVEAALNAGIVSQDGNRLAILEEKQGRAQPSYKTLHFDARKEDGWTDEQIAEEVKAKTPAGKLKTELVIT